MLQIYNVCCFGVDMLSYFYLSVFEVVCFDVEVFNDVVLRNQFDVFQVDFNGELFGCVDVGQDVIFFFFWLVVYVVKICLFEVGVIVGFGILLNKGIDGGLGVFVV